MKKLLIAVFAVLCIKSYCSAQEIDSLIKADGVLKMHISVPDLGEILEEQEENIRNIKLPYHRHLRGYYYFVAFPTYTFKNNQQRFFCGLPVMFENKTQKHLYDEKSNN